MVSLYMFVLTKLKPVQRLADWSSLSPVDGPAGPLDLPRPISRQLCRQMDGGVHCAVCKVCLGACLLIERCTVQCVKCVMVRVCGEVRAADLYYTKEGRQPVCRKSLVSCDDDMMIDDDMAMMTMMMMIGQ